jgi:chorismate mutase
MPVRGIRGATTARANTREEILSATRELLQAIVAANDLALEDVASVLFTVTSDLDAEYPARAARDLGWDDIPLLGATEMKVPGGVPHCIRVLLHVNTDKPASQMKHVYLRGARALRPDR